MGAVDIAHYDGVAWKKHSRSFTSVYDLPRTPSIWGSGSSDVFAVVEPFQSSGSTPEPTSILHYDGIRWRVQSTRPATSLFGIWGTGPTNVWAVGTEHGAKMSRTGVILRYDGKSWKTNQTLADTDLKGMWGASSTDIFTVGYSTSDSWSSVVYHYDGASWTKHGDLGAIFTRTIWGTSSTDVYLFGEAIHHYDGVAWKKQLSKLDGYLVDAWGTDSRIVYAVGYEYESTGTFGDYTGYGLLYRLDHNGWRRMARVKDTEFLGIWGTSDSNAYVVGSGSSASGIVMRFDGQELSVMEPKMGNGLIAIWGSSSMDIFAMGYFGTILHYPNY